MQCTKCNAAWVPGDATICSKCAGTAGPAAGSSEPPPVPSSDDFVGRMIPTGNKPSLIGYYAVFAAWVPFLGIAAAVVAVVYGIKGVRLANLHPEVRGGCHAWFGIVGGVLLGLVGLAMTIAIVLAILSTSPHRL
jgi:hypothetical protein